MLYGPEQTLAGLKRRNAMAKKKVFVSFDFDHDKHYKYLLEAWDANPDFDFVFDGSCFHCIIGEDRKDFLASAYRVLKHGGFFHVRTICGDPWDEETLKTFDKESRCLIREGDIAYRYVGLAQDIIKEITDAGFHILEWETGKGSTDPNHHGFGMDRLLVAARKPR